MAKKKNKKNVKNKKKSIKLPKYSGLVLVVSALTILVLLCTNILTVDFSPIGETNFNILRIAFGYTHEFGFNLGSVKVLNFNIFALLILLIPIIIIVLLFLGNGKRALYYFLSSILFVALTITLLYFDDIFIYGVNGDTLKSAAQYALENGLVKPQMTLAIANVLSSISSIIAFTFSIIKADL